MTGKIKVLHVTFDMGIGGTEQVIKNLVNSTRSSSVEHHIACLETPIGPWGEELAQSGITLHSMHREPKLTWSVVKKLRRIVLDNKIDIVHAHQYTPFVYGFLASLLTKAKLIFTEHGRFFPDIVSRRRKLINRLIFPFVDSVTSISQATKQALIENEAISSSKISVIYNGIEAVSESTPEALLELQKKYDIGSNTVILGTVARLDTIKNQLYMVREFSKCLTTCPDIKLIIVGDGPERSKIEALIEELDIADNVVLTGFISDPKDYINLFDVFLLPSLSEGTSMTLLEAMSAGKRSIVSNVGGNPEIINQNFLGKVIDNKEDSLANAILESVRESFDTARDREIRNWFMSHYSTKTFSNAFLSQYDHLLRVQRTPS